MFGTVGEDGEWKPNESIYNGEELSMEGYLRLRTIVIGDDCFDRIRQLEVVGLRALESMVVGNGSFTSCKEGHELRGGICRVSNCPRLSRITMGDYAFGDYSSLELQSLPSLQSLQIGDGSFYNAPLFSLRSTFIEAVPCRSLSAAVSYAG